jgi:hypothetical protein
LQVEKAQQPRPRSDSGSRAESVMVRKGPGIIGSQDNSINDRRTDKGGRFALKTRAHPQEINQEPDNSGSSSSARDSTSGIKSFSYGSKLPFGVSGGKNGSVTDGRVNNGELERWPAQGLGARLETKKLRNEEARESVASEQACEISKRDQPELPSGSRRLFIASDDGKPAEAYGSHSIPGTRKAQSNQKLQMRAAQLDQKMTLDAWKKLEGRFLSRGGIEGLAFKILRDLLLSRPLA